MITNFQHQADELRYLAETYRALFWEMGTGKSRVIILTADQLHLEGKIDGVVIVAPNGVHQNWIELEIPTHSSLPAGFSLCYHSSRSDTKAQAKAVQYALSCEEMLWWAISYDAFVREGARKYLRELFKKKRILLVADESHYIKTPSAARTKILLKASPLAAYRRILTGTPITQGPFDTYSQVRFLAPEYWKEKGLGTFTAFKQFFGIWRKQFGNGREFPVLVEYQNLHLLQAWLRPISSRVLKEEVLDLPPKMYTKRGFEMTAQQRKVYRELKEELVTWIGEEMVTAMTVLTQLLRLQQVTCGYLPYGDEEPKLIHRIPGGNARLKSLEDVLQEVSGGVIVWARFVEDINQILESTKRLGLTAVRYDGQVSDENRAKAKTLFQAGEAQVFVANSAAGATGLTLTAAKTVVYYSNSFNLAHRLQSEDRAHRIGQTTSVLYVDLMAEGTVDERIIDSLRTKRNLASEVTGEEIRQWL